MRRIITILAATVIAAALTTTTTAGARASAATLQLRKTSVGTILVNSRGFTLYAFTKDGRNRDACVAISGCTAIWPMLTSTGKPLAGAGVKSSLIRTITVKGGAKQVTYDRHPLYTYAADSAPGQTEYVNAPGFGGRWPAVDAAGATVR
jgi:predicted lipoprotein with Yx(FWY)xxD motif